MKIKNILIAALVVLAVLLAACSTGEIKSSEEEARIVGLCGDREIRYEDVRYLTMRYKADLAAQYGADIFASEETGASYEDALWELVTEALIYNCATADACAAYGVPTDDKTAKTEVQEYVDETVDGCGGKSGYMEYLAANFMTDAVFRFHAAILSSQYRYYEKLAAERDREAYDAVLAGEGFIRTVSIFVKNDAGEDPATNRRMAEEVVTAVRNGAAVADYIGTRYNQDTGACDYYFMRGYMIEEYENAAFSLAVGEVSDVVETDGGFYVIQRVAPEEGYFLDNLETLKAMYLSCLMNADIDARQSALSIRWNDLGSSLVLWSME